MCDQRLSCDLFQDIFATAQFRTFCSVSDSTSASKEGGFKPAKREDLLCLQPGCTTYASFNIEGKTKRIRCSAHKLSGMVNISSPRCEFRDCSISSVFNTEGETRGRFCCLHKLEGMVDVRTMRCEDPTCIRQRKYNFAGELLPRFCRVHKKESMIITHRRMCQGPDCSFHANYGFEDQGKQFCSVHKKLGMVNLNTHREKGSRTGF